MNVVKGKGALPLRKCPSGVPPIKLPPCAVHFNVPKTCLNNQGFLETFHAHYFNQSSRYLHKVEKILMFLDEEMKPLKYQMNYSSLPRLKVSV